MAGAPAGPVSCLEATPSNRLPCLSLDAAPGYLGCPSSTARADSPSIRWGNRQPPRHLCPREQVLHPPGFRSWTMHRCLPSTMLDYVPFLREPGLPILRAAVSYAELPGSVSGRSA
jgi:hypothetical protein